MRAAVQEPVVRYLPPFEAIKGLITLTSSRGRTRVDMTYDDMQTLIKTLLSVVEVDEAFYLSHNRDVAQGVALGTIRSAQDHFIHHGYFEGRQPYPLKVNEEWYLETHADVAETVRQGEYPSGQAHFDGPGYPEGRAPFAIEP
jgi:hypothetical protein